MNERKRTSAWDEAAPSKKRMIPENSTDPFEGMTKSELQAALLMKNQSFKDLREIAKRLERYPPISRESEVDPRIESTASLVMKKYKDVQIFVCHRCDHVKTSNMKAKWKGEHVICGSCFDHVTRCVLPYRGLPDHQKPDRCIHKIPKSIQKQFR